MSCVKGAIQIKFIIIKTPVKGSCNKAYNPKLQKYWHRSDVTIFYIYHEEKRKCRCHGVCEDAFLDIAHV